MRAHPLSRSSVVAAGVLVALAVSLVIAPRAWAVSEASMWLTRANGATVPENGTIKTGERITVHVKDFAANATVLLQVGQTQLPNGIDTDASGAGSVGYTAPALKSDVYVFTASSDTDATTYVVSLFNPKNPKPKPAPAPKPTKKPAAATHSSSSSSAHSSSSSSTSNSNSSSSGTLAKTGPVQPVYWLAAIVLLVVGMGMVRIAAPVLLGRHERTGGAHQRATGRRLRG